MLKRACRLGWQSVFSLLLPHPEFPFRHGGSHPKQMIKTFPVCWGIGCSALTLTALRGSWGHRCWSRRRWKAQQLPAQPSRQQSNAGRQQSRAGAMALLVSVHPALSPTPSRPVPPGLAVPQPPVQPGVGAAVLPCSIHHCFTAEGNRPSLPHLLLLPLVLPL